MKLVQFAIPERLGGICGEAAAVVAGGATLLSGIGWWVDGEGKVVRESINWLIVGVSEEKVAELISAVKSILKNGGESAIFYILEGKPKLEWLS